MVDVRSNTQQYNNIFLDADKNPFALNKTTYKQITSTQETMNLFSPSPIFDSSRVMSNSIQFNQTGPWTRHGWIIFRL